MNGSAFAVLGLLALPGLFMLLMWRAWYRVQPIRSTGRALAVRFTALVIWAAGLVTVPLVAHPGDQASWTAGLVVTMIPANIH